MTKSEFLRELEASGLRFHITKTGAIRTSRGECPIEALARKKGWAVSWWQGMYNLGLTDCAEIILDAADGRAKNATRRRLEALCE